LFLGVAVACGLLASRLRRQASAARSRVAQLRRISAFSRSLGEPTTEPELLEQIAREAADIAGAGMVLTELGDDINIRAAVPPADTMDEASWAAARWSYKRREPAGRGSGTLPAAPWRFLPMRTIRGILGVLGVRPGGELDQPSSQALAALADQAAVAIERVRLANAAARSAAQAETQRLRTTLLSSLAHDLRAPLAGIRGAASTLRTQWAELDEATRQELLRIAEDDTMRMDRFLSDILEMTRLESGEIMPKITAVSVPDVVEDATAHVPGALAVGIDVPPDLPAVAADPTLLQQVIANLLDNAVKYSPACGRISVSAAATGGQIAIRVADEGMGVPAEHLPHIFDSFYRVREGRSVAGTGLGLAIAYGLMQAMGGSIEAQSPRPDAPRDGAPGTVITLTLPVAH
jgi:two-component system, OmpR family, sensor histidine kinase KdpD